MIRTKEIYEAMRDTKEGENPNKKQFQDAVEERLQKKGLRSFDSDSGSTYHQLVDAQDEIEWLVDDTIAHVARVIRFD